MKKALIRNNRTRRLLFIKFLLDKGYEVHGIIRRASILNTREESITLLII